MTLSRIRVRLPAKFPATVTVDSPLELTQVNGSYNFAIDTVALATEITGALLIVNNLGDVDTPSTARMNLGVAIGTDVQAFDAQLSSLIRQNSQSADYVTVLTDGGKHIYHPSTDNNPRTFTIDSDANVAYPVGTAITFVSEINIVTIAIIADTLTWAGMGTTGSRSLAASGVATALKVASTKWVISGAGLS